MHTLQTERLILRPWALTDLDDLFAYARDERVGSMAGWRPCASRDDAARALAQYVTQEYHWAIALRAQGRVIGAVKLNPDRDRGRYFAKSIGFVLSPDCWGQGLMTEAVRRVIRYAFEDIGVELLSVFHYPENHRSRRVIEKCGFVYETTLSQSSKRYDGRVFDMVCYSLLRDAYDGG